MQDYLEELLEMSLLSSSEYGYADSDESEVLSEVDDCASV